MIIYQWHEDLSVGVAMFDEHHKKLFDLFNQLHGSIRNKKAREDLTRIIVELLDYSEYHFAAEEKNMLRYEYPEYGAHKREHESFSDQVMEFARNLGTPKGQSPLEVIVFLNDWLKTHICRSDKKYEQFFKGKDIF